MKLQIIDALKYTLGIALILIFLEAVLKIHVLHFTFNISLLRIVSFSIVYASIVTFFAAFFNLRWTRMFTFLVVGIFTFYFLSQDIYYQVMDEFYSFHMTGDAARGFTFLGRDVQSIKFVHLLYFIPLGVVIYLLKKQRARVDIVLGNVYVKPYQPFIFIGSIALLFFLAIQTISNRPLIDGIEDPFNFSEYDLYKNLPSAFQTMDYFGALTYARLDFFTMFGSNDDIDETEQMIRDFFLERDEKEINDYTGKLEDMNFIYILAESLEPFALDESITPTLMKMLDHSMVFENFYAPHYYRNTADTEFMMHTSFYPSRNVQLSMNAFKENYFPNTFPKLFKSVGYEATAFHNYTDYFYPRNTFHPETLGFDDYHDAIRMGLMEEQSALPGNHPWPSDLAMIEYAYDEFVSDEQFFAYLLTVSGHMSYDDSHPQAVKHLPYIESIFEEEEREPIDESLMYYLAANYELELMLEYLLERLEADDLLDNTAIMIVSDHYAYGLDYEVIESIDTSKGLEETHLNVHNVPMFIYNPNIEPEVISQTLSSVDIMPTIANLFNLPMNYRQVIGKDVFDSSFNTVRFQNGSLLNDYYYLEIDNAYNIGKFNPYFKDEEIMIHFNRLIHEQNVNRSILEIDYFNRYRPMD